MRSLASAASLALLFGVGALTAAAPTASQAFVGIGISVNFAPPPLPVYEQPVIPGYGYIWTPGYWAWDPGFEDYYWVPGAWIRPPRVGFLWTPGYWGWNNGVYIFNSGYWGPHVGFYGGVNYGYGYTGSGFFGGEWRGGNFFYNRSVNNIRNVNITNVYERNVTNYTTVNRVSYSGGQGGVQARPTPEQMAAAHEQHVGFTPGQQQQVQAARAQPQQRASVNHGAPAVAATPRPGAFQGPGVVPARAAGGAYRPGPAQAARPQGPNGGVHPQAAQAGRPGGPGAGFNGADRPAPQGPRGEAARPARPEGGPRPAPYQDRQAQPERRPSAPNPGPRPQPRFERPAPQQHAAPRPQPQFARPAPAPHAPPPPRPQPQRPQPQQRPAPGGGEHHEEHHG